MCTMLSVLRDCWLIDKKHIWSVKELECWFIGHGDLTGTFYILKFWLSPLPLPSCLAAAHSRMLNSTIPYHTTLQDDLTFRILDSGSEECPGKCKLAIKTSIVMNAH